MQTQEEVASNLNRRSHLFTILNFNISFVLLGLAQVIVALNLSLRIYAIYLKSRTVLVSLTCIFVTLAAVVLLTNFLGREIEPSNVEGCHIADKRPPSGRQFLSTTLSSSSYSCEKLSK
ncbi:hypothetical protein K435DRAFT_809098 [Dendrothele bispora CBS 962.96]|uniref:Uncharacterized protein n=1 Tax=Dendrothele bispora (strain CBS 962.96) TaxID=1314807 RepID=A0A4S8KZD4_DENBC|nr:hypothetical protein K435DRAFT_809098 [Dendrothele bispora CBS 962.96]